MKLRLTVTFLAGTLSLLTGCVSTDFETVKPEPPDSVIQQVAYNSIWLESCSDYSGVTEDSEIFNRAASVILYPLIDYQFSNSVKDAIEFRASRMRTVRFQINPSICQSAFWPDIERKYLQLEREAIARQREELENQRRAENFQVGLGVLFGALNLYADGQRSMANSYQDILQQQRNYQPYQFQVPQLYSNPTLKTTCNSLGFSTSCETSVDKPVWAR